MALLPSSKEIHEHKNEASVELVETIVRVPADQDVELLSAETRPTAEKQLVKMLDLRLLPTIILIFILNFIDVSPMIPHILNYLLKKLVCTAS